MQSQLSPGAITKRSPAPPRDFYNFMTGGSKALAGATSTGTAANKIVKFTSGAVRPNAPNMSSLISNISTNVNNIETQNITKNVIQSTNKNFSGAISGLNSQFQKIVAKLQSQVQGTLNSLIQNFKKDYQQRIQNKDASSPSNILKNFLGLYRNAVDLITYFGDAKNHKKISTSLKAIRKMFSDSFDVATTIRQTISRIVKQLSNLPTASGAAPDLSIDVRVPGSSLRQSGTRAMSQMTSGRGSGLGIGAGMLGMGLLGAGAAAIGMNRAREFQERGLYSRASGVERRQDVPEGFIDGLQKIISRLVESIDKLMGMGQKPAPARSSGSSSAAPANAQTSGTTSLEGVAPPVSAPVSQEISELSGGAENYSIFKESIANIESKGDYRAQGGANNSFYGRYQLGRPEIAAAAQRANIPVPTTEEFKNNPQLQETLMQHYTMMNHSTLMQNSPGYRNMPPMERLKVLGYAHNAGAGAASRWVESGMGEGVRDSNRTRSRRYYEEIGANLNNPNIRNGLFNLSSSQSNLNVAIGATPTNTGTAQPAAPALPPPPVPQASRPAPSQVAPQIINLPPEIITAPEQRPATVQNRVTPPLQTGSEADSPDVSGLMSTSNPENPYIFLPFSLGIIM